MEGKEIISLPLTRKGVHLIDSNGKPIGQTFISGYVDVPGKGMVQDPQGEQLAEVIIKSVNEHDSLLSELEKAKEAIKALLEENTHLELNLNGVELGEAVLNIRPS